MMEQEWLECADPGKMLEFLRGKVSDRKLRLFAVACCRRIWDSLTDDRSRKAVEAAERRADNTMSGKELDKALSAALRCAHDRKVNDAIKDAAYAAASSAFWLAPDTVQAAIYAVGAASIDGSEVIANREQCNLLHCIFGNPFRSITIDPIWLSSTVLSIAQAIYDEKVFDRMPILADAIEESGCISQDILNHMRSGGEHVKGCWALDLVLGKK
jgi:hypothetical protein